MSKKDRVDFCDGCRGYFSPGRHCERGCVACAWWYCMDRKRSGIPVSMAFREWTMQPISHAEGREIVADALGLTDEELEDAREVLKMRGEK